MIELWIDDNYYEILQWSKNISKGDELSEDLAHYAIEQLLQSPHKRHLETEELKHEGTIRAFILSIMRNSWHGNKSYFTRYYKAHRADIGQRKRWIDEEQFGALLEQQEQSTYSYYQDEVAEAVQQLLDEMQNDRARLWYMSKLFRMWLETPNFSKLSRETGIPRTSISQAVEECREYIQYQLKLRGFNND